MSRRAVLLVAVLTTVAVVSGVRLAAHLEREASPLSGWHLWTETDEWAAVTAAKRIASGNVLDVPAYPRPLMVTDAAINIQPTLKDKVDIAQNAIDLARVLGIDCPRVAVLAAVETVNPQMSATVDAAMLCKMADRGQITGGLIDGPLAFDNAISEEAARIKKIDSPVAGKADILPQFIPILDRAGDILRQTPDIRRVELAGHTDPRDISTSTFPSNWELSDARAKAVRAYLIEKWGIAPDRLTTRGYAEFGIGLDEVARRLGVPPRRLSAAVNRRRTSSWLRVTAELMPAAE